MPACYCRQFKHLTDRVIQQAGALLDSIVDTARNM